ncbi:DUF2254 domain-containing protein [Yinghuangia seranimata]|uniref:DUF2254 domain-containing protein n=1 Tax=Yinghuangia seranimata TaxID=408067 RepID=UPI00248ADB32|nr:DUF2254 domain-containing protein [Yinghuangia seranimata]MDI2131833.1 DUF2254 domain-containing protein [Yinghuangia seranimata]
MADGDAGSSDTAGTGWRSVPAPPRRRPFPSIRERLRDSFLFAPLLGLVVGYFLATATLTADQELYDEAVRTEDNRLLEFIDNVGGAGSAVIGTISSAMLTFVGVVFSITLVALQMASGFTPRVIRLYVRSRVAKAAFALFLCTFLFSLRVQKGRVTAEEAQPFVSSFVAMGLVIASLVLFVVYVHTTLRMMRVTYVIATVAGETALQLWYLERRDGHPPDGPPTAVVPYHGLGGVLRYVDVNRLTRIARGHDTVLRIVPRVGDFVADGTPLVEVYGGTAPDAGPVARALRLGTERSMHQDFAYGFRQLSDIAARALSPAVNDPTTAVHAFDRIHMLLGMAVKLPLGTRVHVDRKGRVRVVEAVPTWADVVDLAYTETRLYGAGAPQVTRRLVASLDDLLLIAPEDRAGPLRRQRELLHNAVRASYPDGPEREFALEPDRQGIG